MATSIPIIENLTSIGSRPIIKRTVYPGEEQSEIHVPIESILHGNELDIYPDVLNKNFFRLHLKGNRIAFQAAGFLGVIPLNDGVAIEVRSRVPLANLERMLLLAPRYAPEILERHLKEFGLGDIQTPSLLDLLALRLLGSIEAVRAEGLHYEYENLKHRGPMPHGRIIPFESASWQAKTGDRMSVTYTAFERTFDTAANR